GRIAGGDSGNPVVGFWEERRRLARRAAKSRVRKNPNWDFTALGRGPTLSAFVPAPDRNGLARILIRELKEPQLLTDGESFWYHGQAALATDLHSLPFGTQAFSSLVPFVPTATRDVTRPVCSWATTSNLTRPPKVPHVAIRHSGAKPIKISCSRRPRMF